jgi:hypothetical protein
MHKETFPQRTKHPKPKIMSPAHPTNSPKSTPTTQQNIPQPASEDLLPNMKSSAEPRPETVSPPIYSVNSSPLEPFPDLDLDIEAELANLSPIFTHEAGMCAVPSTLSLPGPAIGRTRHRQAGPVVSGRVVWMQGGGGDEEEGGEMREATGRALEWARKMFGEEFGGGD